MTKKLFLALALVLMTGYVAQAEQGATAYGGKKYYEQSVFVDAWNSRSTTIEANAVVILDTVGTLGDSAGATITAGSGAGDPKIFGVADSLIQGNSVGRICIRGPHLVLVNPTALSSTYQNSFEAGLVMSTSTTYGTAAPLTYTQSIAGSGTIGATGILGFTINACTAGPTAAYNNDSVWIWVQPQRI